MSNEPLPFPASRPEDVEAAERHISERRMVVSGNLYQAKVVWGIVPLTDREIRKNIEADGYSPFKVLEIMRLDRLRKVAGAPFWAQYAWLVMVEVKASGLGG